MALKSTIWSKARYNYARTLVDCNKKTVDGLSVKLTDAVFYVEVKGEHDSTNAENPCQCIKIMKRNFFDNHQIMLIDEVLRKDSSLEYLKYHYKTFV